MDTAASAIRAEYSISPSERLLVNARSSRGTSSSNISGVVCLLLAALTIDVPLLALAFVVLSVAWFSGYWVVPFA